jgi:hypothetical protein
MFYIVQVKKVKPDVILGLSAVGGLFSKEVRVLAYEFMILIICLLYGF